MNEKINNFKPIDYGLWAIFIRDKRKKMGYTSSKDFAKIVSLNTGVKIKEQSYYKIEQGRQEPTANQFFAINLFIFNALLPPEQILSNIISDEWKQQIE